MDIIYSLAVYWTALALGIPENTAMATIFIYFLSKTILTIGFHDKKPIIAK